MRTKSSNDDESNSLGVGPSPGQFAIKESAMSNEREIERLIHELEVHQVELEMQNEELQAAQQELAASRDRYFELYDLAPVGYLTLDRSGKILEANLAAGTLLGGSRSHLIGRLLFSFIEQSHADMLYRHLGDVFESGTKVGCEFVIDACGQGNGRETTVRIDSMSFDDPSCERRCRSVLIDLSDLRDAQEAQRCGEARDEALFDTAADAIITSDRTGHILSFNKAAERLFGYEQAEVLGKNVQMLTPSCDRCEPDQGICDYLATGGDRRVDQEGRDLHGLRKDGTTFPLLLNVGEWFERGERRFTAIIHDDTEKKKVEEELRQVKKIEAVGALATGVAHDFGNVLQAVLGCVNLAQREDLGRERRVEFLERAASAARRGGKLAEQLMTFARKRHTQAESVELDRVIKASARLIQSLVTEQVVVQVRAGARGAQILADAVQFEQVLMNLAANARDALPEGGELFIRTEVIEADDEQTSLPGLKPADSYVRLVVQDTGVGMDEATRRRIFEPFFTTKEVGKGTGLGLSTVFSVTKKLGAHISVESALGKGTTFTLLFPICKKLSGSSRPRVHHEVRFVGTTLLVEDDATIRMTLCHKLEELGLEVLEAEDPSEALNLCELHRGELDVLITDVILPVMPGTRLAERLRERYPKMHVLLMSASRDVLHEHGNEASLGEYLVLQKPFGKEELSEQLEKVLPSHRVERESLPPSPSTPGVSPESTDGARPGNPVQNQPVIMVVDDEATARHTLRDFLEGEGYHVLLAGTSNEALDIAERESRIDVLVSDVQLPQMSGYDLAEKFREQHPGTQRIIMSALLEPPSGDMVLVQKPIDLGSLVMILKEMLSTTHDG